MPGFIAPFSEEQACVVLNPSEGMCLPGVLQRFMTGNLVKRRPCERLG